jgi:alpha-beta hydrolase superfamily lysophospholipase
MMLDQVGFAFTQSTPLSAEPVSFDGIVGWYGPGLLRRGVVLCGTLGYEQTSAYRGWRQLAADLSAAGHPTLRFDYPGEGDSADPATPDVATLVASIRRAVRFLREEGGTEEVVLVGLRLGATLATLAAEGCGIDGLVLLAPFGSGRAYTREMTLRAKAIDQLPDGRPLPQDPTAPVFGGFPTDAGLLAGIGRIDLAKGALPAVPRVMLLGPDPAGLVARWREAGSAVVAGPFPGLAPFLSNALISETPRDVFAAIVGFVAEGAALRTGGLVLAPPAAPIATDAWTEETIRFWGNVGVLCTPASAAPDMPAVLLLNSGINPRSGYGRQSTAMARSLAAAGIRSLRMDLHGCGDAEDRRGGGVPLYALDTLDEVRAGIDRLDTGNGVVVTGNCSAAFLGFHALCRDERVRAGVIVNLYCFDWDPAVDIMTFLPGAFRSTGAYASLLRQPDAWRRLLKGQVKVGAILKRVGGTVLRQLRTRAKRMVQFIPSSKSVAGRIAAIRKRHARLVLVFSAGEAGLGEVATHLGRSPRTLAKRLGHPLVVLPETDHNLCIAGAQDRLREILLETLKTAAADTPRYRASVRG